MKKIMIIAGLLLTTNTTMADITKQARLKSIYTYNDYAIIYFTKKISTPCKKKNHLKILDIRNTGKAMYAAALSATQGNNAVWIGYTGCSSWGKDSIGKIYSVTITN